MNVLKNAIRDVIDFPKKGIIFKDITPLLINPLLFKKAVIEMAEPFKNISCDAIIGVESRGFIFAASMALLLEKPFIPVRKKGKLPYKTISESYELEYGFDTLEIHADAIKKGDNVLIVDDLLATGGTVSAVARLIEKLQGNVIGLTFLIELSFLNGRSKLKDRKVVSLIDYKKE